MRKVMRKIKAYRISRRLTAFLLCLSVIGSIVSGAGVITALACSYAEKLKGKKK